MGDWLEWYATAYEAARKALTHIDRYSLLLNLRETLVRCPRPNNTEDCKCRALKWAITGRAASK